MKEYVAFQTVDPENDIWCNKAFLFSSMEEAESFFVKDNKDLISLFTSKEEDWDIQELENFKKITWVNWVFLWIEFETEHAWEVRFLEMSKWFVIENWKIK